MEESKDEGLVGNSSECSIVAESESEEQTLEQVQGTFVEGFGAGSCNGDDLMVEVLGSEVYGGGVFTSGSGEILDEIPPPGKNEALTGDGSEKDDSLEEKDRVFVVAETPNCETERIENVGEGTKKEGSLLVSESVQEKYRNLESCEVETIKNEAREVSVPLPEEGVVLGIDCVEEARVPEENAVLMSSEVEYSGDLGEQERVKSEIGNGVTETEVTFTEVVLDQEAHRHSESLGSAKTIHGSDQVVIETEVTVTEAALDSEAHCRGENSAGSGEEEMGNTHGSDQVLVETEVTVTEVISVPEPNQALNNDLTGDIEVMEEERQVTLVEEVKFESEDRAEAEVNKVESQRESLVVEDSVPETDNRVGDYVGADEVMISEMDLLEHHLDNTDQKDIPEEAVVKEEKTSIESPDPEYGEEFSVLPDLVWGKVKSHPWWPGQVFDSSDASEKALKHHKKDCLLVAYFGDRTFAWNEESTLKSFWAHFSEMVSQSNGETFHKAVGCALEEVSRRIELGLACPCVAGDWYENTKVQVVENAGMRPELSRREHMDESVGAGFFRPENLVEYIRSLAQFPSSSGSDGLGLAISKAQLLSFSRFRGYCRLPELQFCGELAENDTAGLECQVSQGEEEEEEEALSSHEMIRAKNRSSLKRKHNLRDSEYPKVKEKSLSELMGLDYPDVEDDHDQHHHQISSKKRRSSGDDETKTILMAKVSPAPPKQSFKIGECIRRVASQMAVKGNSNLPESVPTEYSTLDELLVQLQLIAQDPRKEYTFSNVIVNFFSDFRNSAVSAGPQLSDLEKSSGNGKRKRMSPETFEFDDMIDTYWTDRVIQNGATEDQPSQPPPPPPSQPQPSARKGRKKDNQLALVEKTPRQYNRKKNQTAAAAASSLEKQKPPGYVNENAPAELVMNFSEARLVPPEAVLGRMFRRFGPLKEAETEVDIESSRARVVFRRCSDAEVAFNSAGKFSIFGNIPVKYQLNYTPTAQFKTVPLLVTLDRDMQLALVEHDHQIRQLDHHDMDLDIQLDLSGLSAFEVNLA